MGRFVNTLQTQDNSVFARLGEIAEIANMSEKQRRKYDKDIKILRDSHNILNYAIEQGHNEGFAEGREEGGAEGRAEIAIEMLKDGMSIEKVAQIAKLTIAETEQLKKKLTTDGTTAQS